MRSVIIVIILLLFCPAIFGLTDRYVTSAAGGGGDGSSGTPWTLTEAAANYAADDRINIQSDGTYTLSGDITFSTDAGTTGPVILRGYDSTIGDLDNVTVTTNFPEIDSSTYSIIVSGDGILLQNLYIHGSDTAQVVYLTGSQNGLYRCRVDNTGTADNPHAAVTSIQENFISNCYLKTSSTESTVSGSYNTVGSAFTSGGGGMITDCLLISTRMGISIDTAFANGYIDNCIIFCDSALASHGVFINSVDNGGELVTVTNCTIFQDNGSNTGDGIHLEEMPDITDDSVVFIKNNIIEGWGSYACDTADTETWPVYLINNATYNNGGTFNFGDTPVLANIAGLALSASPFTDATNGDFTLNNTAGAGAVCRGGAVNSALDWGGDSHSDNRDLGAAQHADPAGGGITRFGGNKQK